MRSVRLACLLVAALASCGGRSVVANPGGNATSGVDKAAGCLACHGAGAPSTTAAPNLVGKPAAFVATQLTAFKRGERVHALMTAISHQLGDGDISDLATFWAAQPTGGAPRVTNPAVIALWRPRMAFPQRFPDGFTRYRATNNPERGAINVSYVNAIGLAAARSGHELPDGSVIIMINYTPKLDADGKPAVARDGSWSIDHVSSYSGMEVRAGSGAGLPALLRNADWSYNLFNADKTPRAVNQAECLACHKAQAAVDYLFGFQELHEVATAK